MVNRCFRRQHPEAYGLPDALEGTVPSELRSGRTDWMPGPEDRGLPEEPMGYPDAVPL